MKADAMTKAMMILPTASSEMNGAFALARHLFTNVKCCSHTAAHTTCVLLQTAKLLKQKKIQDFFARK